MMWFQASKGLDNYIYNESGLNRLGYILIYELKRPKEAIQVFEFAVSEFPKSPNCYDSLAEAFLINGEHALSIKNYRKSIQFDNSIKIHQLGFLSPKEYMETNIPSDTTELFIVEGDWQNKVAYVYVQGGPDIDLQIDGKDALHLMPNENRLLKIYPLQSQILNPDLLIANPYFLI